LIKRIDEGDEIADEVEYGVGVDVDGDVGVTIAAEVRSDGAVSAFGEVENLIAP
jgi:hypothetical protein